MAEQNTAEADMAAEAGFSAGFVGTPPDPSVKVADEPKVEAEPKPDAAPAPAPAPKPEKPEYVRITREERDKDKAAIGKIAALESQLARLTGSIPKADQLTQQIIDRVRADTPANQNVEFSQEDVAELADEYPELADKLLKVLNKGRVKGTGPAEPPKPTAAASSEPVDIDKAVEAALAKREAQQKADALKKEMDALTEAYPEWGKIVGAPIAMGTADPVETEWRKWATTNDQAALTSDSPSEVKASIDRFHASQKAPAKPDRAAARRSVIEDAVTPRADGAPPLPAPPQSVEDAFGEGFKTVRAH